MSELSVDDDLWYLVDIRLLSKLTAPLAPIARIVIFSILAPLQEITLRVEETFFFFFIDIVITHFYCVSFRVLKIYRCPRTMHPPPFDRIFDDGNFLIFEPYLQYHILPNQQTMTPDMAGRKLFIDEANADNAKANSIELMAGEELRYQEPYLCSF